jgi:hypothetical protein
MQFDYFRRQNAGVMRVGQTARNGLQYNYQKHMENGE